MGTCVEIAIADDGTITVGLCDEPADDSDSMQPAQSLQQALAMAKHLLTQPAGADAMSGGAPGNANQNEGTPDGTGGGTGPDSGGSTVQSVQGDDSGQNAQAIWDALANMNVPQN